MQAAMPLTADLGINTLPTNTPPSEGPAPRRSGRARTSRVRDDFIDSAFLQYVTPDDQARAFADNAEAYPPSSQQSKRREGASKAQSPVNTASSIAYTAPDDRPVGPEHQATNIPAFRPLPAQLSASESRFLHLEPLYGTADQQPADAGNAAAAARAAASAVFRASYQAAPPGAARVSLLDAAVKALDAQMGPDMVKVLRLDTLGSKLRASWQPHEELLFCLGMCDKYRFFKYIRQLYLRSRSANDLNGYYHNVWKTRSTPEADEFLSLREQGASDADLYAFVGKTTDKLTAVWDRATMGELPKLLKVAAGAAEAELQAAAMDIACSEDAAPSPSASWATAAASSDSDTPSVKAPAAAAAATPVPRPRQRKRPASGAVSSRKRSQPQAQAPQQQQQQTAQGKTSPQVPPSAPRQQQQQPAQGARAAPVLLQWIQPVSFVSASAVAAAVAAQQQQQLLQQRQVQAQAQQQAQAQALKQEDVQRQPKRQRSEQPSFSSGAAAAAGTGTVPSVPGLDTSAVLQYPQMPTYNEPDMDSPAALDDWLEQLPAYKASVTEYMTAVNSLTDAAVLDYQKRIQQVQEHRGRLQAEAEAYIRSLVAQGQQVLRIVEARAASASEQQPAPPAQQSAAAPAVQQQRQQQQGGSADLQAAVQQLLSSHTTRTKSAAAEPAAALKAADMLPSPVSPASKAGGVAAACPTTPVVDAQRPRQDIPGARGTAAAAGSPAGCVGSSSEDCDMYLACTEAV